MDLNKTNQILRIAKMYHEEHLSQVEIAQIEEISKPTVSRLLKKAEQLGFVKTYVVQPFYSTIDLETEIKSFYPLKKITIVPNLINNRQALIRDINRSLLNDLKKLVKDGDLIGATWGNTMTQFGRESNTYDPFDFKDVQVIQLNGGASIVIDGSGSMELLQSMTRLFNADAYQICAPAFVQKKETAQNLKEDPQIKSVLTKGKNCDIAIFSAGLVKRDGLIFSLGCLEDKDIKKLREDGAVGDVCSHFLKKNGELASPDLDKRCMALSLDELKKIPEKILIAYGKEKAEILRAALNCNLVDRLYIDEALAKALIRLKKNEK